MKVFFSRILAWLPERDYLQHLQAKNELGDAEDVEEVTNEVVVVVLQLLLGVPAVAIVSLTVGSLLLHHLLQQVGLLGMESLEWYVFSGRVLEHYWSKISLGVCVNWISLTSEEMISSDIYLYLFKT